LNELPDLGGLAIFCCFYGETQKKITLAGDNRAENSALFTANAAFPGQVSPGFCRLCFDFTA